MPPRRNSAHFKSLKEKEEVHPPFKKPASGMRAAFAVAGLADPPPPI